jgi:hypothetical protein
MIEQFFAVGFVAALGVATAPLAPAALAANGSGPHFSHGRTGFSGRPALLHHRVFRHRQRQHDSLLVGYGGVAPDAYVAPDIDAAYPINFIVELPTLHCQHSRETVTVPSEDGGTRAITITRC